MSRLMIIATIALGTPGVYADWAVLPGSDQRQPLPDEIPGDAEPIEPGDPWPQDNKFRWLIGDLTVPDRIDDKPTEGQAVGMRLNCGDGGEVHLNGKLQTRFDNDHPALVLIDESATPGKRVKLAVEVYGKVQGGDRFGEVTWVIVDPGRARERLSLTVQAKRLRDPVPDGIAGLSQGGGLADYEDATAAMLRDGGFKWFRMDNILTPVVREKDGELVYDWADFDRRVDFIADKMQADPILAVSYMPIPFDAVENHDRQSAPKDYGLWEDLCYRAAKRCVDRGHRVPYWEVWNEVNTGWLKPGPEDKGTPAFKKLYEEALGAAQPEEEVIRRFEAYCKLYQATVRGVRRADPKAKFGGPALASGPFEHSEKGHCFHGKGFARGLMSFCSQENLPLDFVSWHEYFQPASVYAEEVKAFRAYLADYPKVVDTVRSYMITEWNEAWWGNRPMDHEIGAAYAADCITRVFIPLKVDRPCFFYVKQGDNSFRGDFSLLMAGNVPKATYHVLRMFNRLSGNWLEVTGTDDDVSAVACWDADRARLALILVNYRDRYALARRVRVVIDDLPTALRKGSWREWRVDAEHSNVWHDRHHPELAQTDAGRCDGAALTIDRILAPNSVTLVELVADPRAEE